MELTNHRPSKRRREHRRGSEVIEFSLVIMPMFAMIFVQLDIAWGVFVKATLEQACRLGVRYAITNAVPDPNRPELCSAGSSLSDCVTMHVQWAAGAAAGRTLPLTGGLLSGSAGANYIQIQYYPAGSTTAVTPSGGSLPATANNGGNVILVSVTGYPISTLVGPYIAPPSVSTTTVSSADTLTTVLNQPSP